MPLSKKEKRGLIIGLITGSIVLVVVIITVVLIVVFERKKVKVVKDKLPEPSGVAKVKDSDVLGGKNASTALKPAQSGKATDLDQTLVSSSIVDSWKGVNLAIVGNTELSYAGSFGKIIPLKNRGSHITNEYFEQSSLGPMYLVARKKLLSVEINFTGTFYIFSYKTDNDVEINPQITAIKLKQGKETGSQITTTRLHDSLKMPLTSPPLARKIQIDSTFVITDHSNTNVPISFEKDDVLAILFSPEGTLTYTPYAGSVSVISAVVE
jgi:hypothetical protein